MEPGYVVENVAYDARTGERRGTFRIYVSTEARARELGSAPGCSWRAIALEEMPVAARDNLIRARAEDT